MITKNKEQGVILVTMGSADREKFLLLIKSIRHDHNIPESEYTDSQAYRFYRGHLGNSKKALEAILANIEWRRNAPYNQAAAMDLGRFSFLFEHVKMGFYGLDFKGRPIRIVRPSNIDPEVLAERYPLEERYLYALQNLERILNIVFPLCSKKAGRYIEGMITIIDIAEVTAAKIFKGISLMNSFKPYSMQLQDNYPEMAHKAIIINAGVFFTGFWNIIKLFLNKATLEKVVILGSDYMGELLKYTTKENLPTCIGGTCEHDINHYPNFFEEEYQESEKERSLTLKYNIWK